MFGSRRPNPPAAVAVTESQLIERVLRGDAAAERALYDAHVDRVYRLAYRMAGDADLAQDFTQETFIRAFDRLSDFRGDSAFSTWLHRIGVSVVLNGLRKHGRHGKREADLEEATTVCGSAPSSVEPDLRDRLHQAIDGLPEIYRTVFVMHHVEGYTHEEIGGVLECPTGTTKARLARARARLRAALADFAQEWAR